MMIFLSGCGGDPYSGHYAKTKPNQQWFVGEWRLQARSPDSSPSRPTKLTLRADGSFVAGSYPARALGSLDTGAAFVDGEGTWGVGPHQFFWVLGVHWTRVGTNRVDYGDMLPILNNKPPHLLHHVIGDPDSGEALVFEKTK
jgi:hypothetical protein